MATSAKVKEDPAAAAAARAEAKAQVHFLRAMVEAEAKREEAKKRAKGRYRYIPGNFAQYVRELEEADRNYDQAVARAAAAAGVTPATGDQK